MATRSRRPHRPGFRDSINEGRQDNYAIYMVCTDTKNGQQKAIAAIRANPTDHTQKIIPALLKAYSPNNPEELLLAALLDSHVLWYLRPLHRAKTR